MLSSLRILITVGLFHWQLSFGCLLGDWLLLGDLVPLGTFHWLLGTFYTPLLGELWEMRDPWSLYCWGHTVHPCWEIFWEMRDYRRFRNPCFSKYSDKLEVVCRSLYSPASFCWRFIRDLNISSRRFCLKFCKNSPLGGKTDVLMFLTYWRSDVLDILTFWCSGHTDVLMFWTYWCSDVLDILTFWCSKHTAGGVPSRNSVPR